MIRWLGLVALLLALGGVWAVASVQADPSPTATVTLLNSPTYGGYATIRLQIEGHVKFPAGVVWCSQWVGGVRQYHGYWEAHYPSYQRTMDVTLEYGTLMSPSPNSVDLEGWWDPASPTSCSFIAFAEAQGKNGKGPFGLEGGWLPFNVPAVTLP
jgi:hypothetical protein